MEKKQPSRATWSGLYHQLVNVFGGHSSVTCEDIARAIFGYVENRILDITPRDIITGVDVMESILIERWGECVEVDEEFRSSIMNHLLRLAGEEMVGAGPNNFFAHNTYGFVVYRACKIMQGWDENYIMNS